VKQSIGVPQITTNWIRKMRVTARAVDDALLEEAVFVEEVPNHARKDVILVLDGRQFEPLK
jgi:hypothetical protein